MTLPVIKKVKILIEKEIWDCGKGGTDGHRHTAERLAIVCQLKQLKGEVWKAAQAKLVLRNVELYAYWMQGNTYVATGRKFGLSGMRVKELVQREQRKRRLAMKKIEAFNRAQEDTK